MRFAWATPLIEFDIISFYKFEFLITWEFLTLINNILQYLNKIDLKDIRLIKKLNTCNYEICVHEVNNFHINDLHKITNRIKL